MAEITKKDIDLLKEEIKQEFSDLQVPILSTKEDIKEIKQDVVGLKEQVQGLTISVDKLVKAVSDLNTEHAAIIHKIDRREKWLELLAEKVGLKLEY